MVGRHKRVGPVFDLDGTGVGPLHSHLELVVLSPQPLRIGQSTWHAEGGRQHSLSIADPADHLLSIVLKLSWNQSNDISLHCGPIDISFIMN